MSSRGMKNDTQSSHVWSPAYAGFLRSRALRRGRGRGSQRGGVRVSRDPTGPGAGREARNGARDRCPARRDHGQLGPHPLRPAPSALLACGAANVSVSPTDSWVWGSPVPALGGLAPFRVRTGQAGGSVGGQKLPAPELRSGREAPGRPRAGRPIPEDARRAGLGEQRAGGGPGLFVDL